MRLNVKIIQIKLEINITLKQLFNKNYFAILKIVLIMAQN